MKRMNKMRNKYLMFILLAVLISACQAATQKSNDIESVGIPTEGEPTLSLALLPQGIENGTIVLGEDNLYYFIWENTKSRIWFPQQVNERDILSLPDGLDKGFKLVGRLQNKDSVGYLVISDKGNVYWIDPVTGSKYPIKISQPLQIEIDSIPAAFRRQYFPVYK